MIDTAKTQLRFPASDFSVHAELAVQLQGPHTAEAVCMARSVLLVMPTARIRITHPQPIHAAYSAWAEALPLAVRLFRGTEQSRRSAPEPGPDIPQIGGHLHFDSETDASVDALTAQTSSTGKPQIRVRLGGLLIITSDVPAVMSQVSVWTSAYAHATRLWPELPPPATASASLPRIAA